MMQLIYPNNGRKLKQMITGLLKSGLVQEVRRINYVKSYTLVENKIHPEEVKQVELLCQDQAIPKIIALIQKQRPEARIL